VAAIASTSDGPSELIIYAVLAPSVPLTQQGLKTCFQRAICDSLNPLFRIKDVIVVNTLPRTASQKILRRDLRRHYMDQKSTIQE
jgi:acetyl-CoA synthetase